MVVRIGDVEVACPVHRHACGRGEPSLTCRTAVPPEIEPPSARNRRDRPCGVNPADPAVVPIGDVEVACSVHRHACGRADLRLARRATIAAETALSRARNRRDRPGGVDLADAVAVPIGDVEVARSVDRHACGKLNLRLARRSAVPAEPGLPRPRHGRDRPGGIDPADAVVAGIGDVEVARSVHRHACGRADLRLARRSAVPATVVIVPVESTLRTRLLPASAM